jgi:CheY-like chemotaxis protein
VPPSRLLPELGEAVDAFFSRAFAPSVDERFGSAVALATEFGKLTDGPSLTTQVLVLDDEPDVQLLLEHRFRKAIQEERYSFYFAKSGEEGLAALIHERTFDVVLTDINMPVMDGLSFLARVPEVDQEVRVIVVSAYSDMLNIRAAMNRGAFDFVCKPLDFADVERTIDRAATVSRSMRRLHRLREERDLMRAVLGPERADSVVRDVGICGRFSVEGCKATVVAIGVTGYLPFLAARGGEELFAHVNARVNIVLQELTRHGASMVRFQSSVSLAIFKQARALESAVAACISARDQLMNLGVALAEDPPSAAVSFGIAAGDVTTGGFGSASSQGIEQVVLGTPCEEAVFLQKLAGPGEILLPADHRSELEGSFALDFRVGPVSAVRSTVAQAIVVLGGLPRQVLASEPTRETLPVFEGAWRSSAADTKGAPG